MIKIVPEIEVFTANLDDAESLTKAIARASRIFRNMAPIRKCDVIKYGQRGQKN